jgi:hypothetical protein
MLTFFALRLPSPHGMQRPMPLLDHDIAAERSALPRRVWGWLARVRTHAVVRSLGRLLPALIPALVLLPAVLAPPLNHDVAAVLDFSERWLAGEYLYSDLIDVNPPLIFVLNLVPAELARLTPLDGPQALQLCLIALGMFAWWLAVSVRDRASEGPSERAFLDVLPLLFLLDAGYDFGQREHIMTVAALPYLLASARRARGERPRHGLAVGVLAGIGFALKPHFLAVPGLIELAVLGWTLPRGWKWAAGRLLRDPVAWGILAVWTAYLVSLPLVFPDYLGVVAPLVWSYYLDFGGLTTPEMLLLPRLARILMVLLPACYMAVRVVRHSRDVLPAMLGLAAMGALASALTQHKGWSYHIVPIELFTLGLVMVLATRWLDAQGVVRTRRGAARVAGTCAALFALYVMSSGEAPWKELDYATSDPARLTALLEDAAEGERVLILSPAIYPIFPAVNYAHVQMTSRQMDMWLLAGAYPACLPDGRLYREVWEMRRPEFFVYRTVAEDFARTPPAAVVVDSITGVDDCGGRRFDYVAYFSRHPLFAEVWSHYTLTAQMDHLKIYTRKD